MEFPKDPTRRQKERQQAIATVISGMAYGTPDMAIDVDFVPEDDPPIERISGMQDVCLEAERLPGFDWQTFQTYLR